MAKVQESLGVNEDAEINAGKSKGWFGAFNKTVRKGVSGVTNVGAGALDIMGDMVRC